MNYAQTAQYDSWLCQLYYYLVTSTLVDEQMQSYHDLDHEYWWSFYDMGLTAKDAVKVFLGWNKEGV